MAFLEGFSQEDRIRLVALPYRAGLWVSRSDSTGGPGADQNEIAALEQTIVHIAQGMFESAFVHEVIAETFLNKGKWPEWSGDITTIPDECRAVVQVLQGKLPQRDIDAYRHVLMQIGLDVALAFRETGKHVPVGLKIQRGISLAFNWIFGFFQREKFVSESILNISYEEDKALNALAQALRADSNAIAENVGAITNS